MQTQERTNVMTFVLCVLTMPVILAVLVGVTIWYSHDLSARRAISERTPVERSP